MKSALIKTVISLVFLVIFNVVFFVGGVTLSDANWCSYGFASFAYLCLLATPLLAKGSCSAILVGSLWLRALFFFFTELVIAIIFIFAEPTSIKWPLIVQGVLLAIFIILQLMSVMANDSTTASLQKQREESFSRQILIDRLQQKTREITDPSVKPILNRCLDALNNSPIQTYPEALDAEIALSNAVDNLCTNIVDGNIPQIKFAANTVLHTIQDRNLVIKRCRIK